MMTIHELAKRSGVSVRALHYYDKIGLLKPCCIESNGYRKYNQESLLRLQQILFYKEMDLSLKQIKDIIDSPDYDQMSTIRNQKDLLIAKRNRLTKIIEQMDFILKGENALDFSVFEHNELKEVMRNRIDQMDEYYRQSLIKEHGSVEAFLESATKNMNKIKESAVKYYGSFDKYIEYLKQAPFPKEGMGKLQAELDQTVREIAAYKGVDVSSPQVQELVEKWKSIMNQMISLEGSPNDITEIFRNIYRNYINSKEIIQIIDQTYGEGASVYIGKAMEYNDTNMAE